MPAHASIATAVPPAPGRAGSAPLYLQVKQLLLRSLQAGEWGPGELIPSEMDLAARFRVSQGTVRKAVDALAADHLVRRRQGKGTFVATHAEQAIQYRFLRLQPDDGDSSPLVRAYLDCRRARAGAEVARALALKAGEAVVEVQRTLSRGARVVVLDHLWLPGALFRGLDLARLQHDGGSLYSLFEAGFGVRMIRADERIRAVAADPGHAAALGVAPGAPLLSVERVSYTYGDRPVELRRGWYDTSAHHYRNRLA